MSSTFNIMDLDGENEDEVEFERFDDFTLASSWERFISEIEAVSRQWLADGPNNLLEKGAVHLSFLSNLYMVKCELKYAMKSYCMEYYFEHKSDGKVADWNSNLHDLQLSFGVREFVVVSPQSANAVVLDAPEASKLLSAVAIALSNCSCVWPAFVPVHDPSRKAYIGIQDMGTVYTRRFEADRIGSQVPVKLLHLEGLYELFVSKFAYSSLDYSMHLFKVHFTMKLTYKTLPIDDDGDIQEVNAKTMEAGEKSEENAHNRIQWDDDCPWSEWYSAEDPVKGFELISIWSEKIVESSLEMAELENASPHEADKWILDPNLSPNLISSSKGNTVGFASQLYLLVNAFDLPFKAQFMEDFTSVENSGSHDLKSPTVVPPPTVIDRVIKDLFHEEVLLPDFEKGMHKSSQAIKGAPLESLFAQLSLHSLWFGTCSIRAIAVLWIEFVREVRWHWEESQPLPKMSANGVVDLDTCLINQKLQMLAVCIERKRLLDEEYQDCIDNENLASAEEGGQDIKNSSCVQEPRMNHDGKHDSPMKPDNLGTTISSHHCKPEDAVVSSYKKTSDRVIRRGSAGVMGSMMLLKTCQNMHDPYTQEAPLMTEDMHDERLKAMEDSVDSFSFSAQLEKDILSSDMSAFKAANPDAVFEDFIRWHSPGDWVEDSKETEKNDIKDVWPPVGQLSQRMCEGGNSWRLIWNKAPTVPASEQKPLLDANREGEKILHYLETLHPRQLLEQLVCTAFRASADTLNQTSFGNLKQMTTKMDQFYLTIASALRPLKGKPKEVYVAGDNIDDYSEIIDDLRRLCTVFDHVEKLLALAASLHRKFLHAPRLAEGIFSDYYNHFLTRTRIASDSVQEFHTEFDKKQKVRFRDRGVVSNLFTPPTANQSWRNVLSLGNLLNGHEPSLREIIFSKKETASGGHYAAPKDHDREIETYRMYTCGTSNDLRVSLSVASSD